MERAKRLEMLLEGWNQPMEQRFFRGHHSISLGVADYSMQGLNGSSPAYVEPKHVIFKPEVATYGIILTAPRKERVLDVAVLGFNQIEDFAECVQLQGAPKMFRELTPVMWDRALIASFISLARQAGLRHIAIPHYRTVEGYDVFHADRFEARYDRNALAMGFEYHPDQQKFVYPTD